MAFYFSVQAQIGYTETFFKADFDTGSIGSEGVWSWETPYSPSNEFGMMVGEGDIYSVSNDVSLQSGYSLRLDFAGRNGWCNSCGSDSYTVSSSLPEAGANSLVVDGEDFSTILPSNLRTVFNKSDRWSAWSASNVIGSQVSFVGDAPISNSMNGSALFKPGDEIKVTKACGVDGVVGGDINRRNDCNLAINYLQGISNTNFEFEGTLSKRFYLYIDENAVLPSVGLKLGYSKFNSATPIAYVDVNRDETLMVDTASPSSRFTVRQLQFERGRWYYLEETFIRESSSAASDGIYRLYLSAADATSTQPLVERTDMSYGDIKQMSIIGNWQHYNDASGYIYIDSVEIADHYIGPIDYKAPANPPPEGSLKGTVVQ
ncbi:hypothetical protein [Oleiphilus sp. HI0079]|uniref:hypothetical protein n=1 Tax=Oleiphilus sp. HI0079 TaxID=1822254 RepID=UPI0012E7D325|nr:hypothetical protein [Oleiphilus sp. HI0079]